MMMIDDDMMMKEIRAMRKNNPRLSMYVIIYYKHLLSSKNQIINVLSQLSIETVTDSNIFCILPSTCYFKLARVSMNK
jgi:hypothetical protein